MTSNVTPLPFHGDLIDYLNVGDKTVEVLWRDREAYIPIRPVCEKMGIDRKSQQRKLQSPDSDATGVMMTPVAADGKEREMFCLAYPDFMIWLAGITLSRVKEEAREPLRLFRREVKAIIAEHYRERLLGEQAASQAASTSLEMDWMARRSWRHPILTGCRNRWTFAQIRGQCAVSARAWMIADDIRAAYRLGFIDWTPDDLPLPRKLPQPKAVDDRQQDLFAEV